MKKPLQNSDAQPNPYPFEIVSNELCALLRDKPLGTGVQLTSDSFVVLDQGSLLWVPVSEGHGSFLKAEPFDTYIWSKAVESTSSILNLSQPVVMLLSGYPEYLIDRVLTICSESTASPARMFLSVLNTLGLNFGSVADLNRQWRAHYTQTPQ